MYVHITSIHATYCVLAAVIPAWFCVLKSSHHELGQIVYYILSVVFASCFYVLFKFWFVREANQGSPFLTSLKPL